jgi:hypothetical protein
MEKYQDKLQIHQIIVITGGLDINLEYKRKSVRAREIKLFSISTVREQARDL